MDKMLIDLPEIEYLDGRPYPKVSPKRAHSMVQLAIATILNRCAQGRGAAGPEWRFRLAKGTHLVPDVGYVSYDRLRALSDEEAEEPPFAPDIAAEVRSPSHRTVLEQEKIQKYLAHGAQLVLDIDPSERSVYSYEIGGACMAFNAGDTFACDVVPWLTFDVDELFVGMTIPR